MIEFSIPGEAPSTPNLREHWAAKAKRVKSQRAAVLRRIPEWTGGPLLVVRLTRVAPRRLDTDNLAAALKAHRDAIASRLRVDDATPLVHWEYTQAKGEPAVVVQIWPAGTQAPNHPAVEARPKRGKALAAVKADAGRPLRVVREPGSGRLRSPRAAYTPPRSLPVDAAREAAETFAPKPKNRCRANREGDCFWGACPQEANHRANYNHAGCPLYVREDDD